MGWNVADNKTVEKTVKAIEARGIEVFVVENKSADTDGDGINDVTVDIGPVNTVANQPTTGLRVVSSVGRD